MAPKTRYLTPDRIEWLKKQDGVPRKTVCEMFNVRYGTNMPYRTMVYHLGRLGVKAPDSHFQKGHDPWNRGMERDEFRTHFTDEEWEEMTGRVLNAPHKRNKVGDVKLINGKSGKEPWIVVRTGHGLTTYETLKQLDRFIWEQRVGKIPDDYCIIHLNYNSLDCTPGNLAIIPKTWFLTFTHWMRSEDPEINRTTILWLTLRDAMRLKGETV